MYEGWARKYSPCTATLQWSIVLPLLINPLLIPHLEWSLYGGAIVVIWFHEELGQVTKYFVSYSLTISQDICVAHSSSSRHLSQMGSYSIPIWIGALLGDSVLLSSPTTHLTWSLFNFNRSFVPLVDGPSISPIACVKVYM
jgi:hypothetical protein